MLIELRIENLAVIEHLAVRLGPGLNALTGETGAGKSIIVGALSLLLGERASSDAVREDSESARVEGVFDISGREDIGALLDEQGIESEDGLLILRREVAVEGRNRAWVNGAATTARFVGRLGRRLVDLHGQHEHQTLLRGEEQRDILDAYGGHQELADAVDRCYAEWAAAMRELETLEERRREIEQRADFLRFQAEEIEKAGLESDEEERLEAEATRLEHSEELVRLSEGLHDALYAGDDALVSVLGALRRQLEELARIDTSQEEARELLESAYYGLEEVGRRMGDYATNVEHDPRRLEEIRRRQDLIFRLERKYGDTLEEVIETGRRAREELDTLEGGALERRTLEKRVDEARSALDEAAGALSAARRTAGDRLAADVQTMLPDLGFDSGQFEVRFEPLDEVGRHGAEAVEFQVALNVGFEPRPLARIASGGELSRIMLALKTILARLDSVPTLVFDEVDAGIGGRIAARVGAKLGEVAVHHQVFVVTHLPQIASRADNHLLVEKMEREGTTLTRLTDLADQDRVRELARMLGGDPESEVSLEHARELLESTPVA